MDIKRVCQFLLDKEPDKPDAKLRYRIKWNDNKNIVAFNVGYRVDIEKWSIDTQRCKNNTTHGKKKFPANVINREIQRFEDAALKAFTDFEKSNKVPDTSEFRAAFNAIICGIKQKQSSLFDIFDVYVEQMKTLNSWEESNDKRHASLKKHLQHFKNDLSFNNLTESVMIDFIKYQQSKEAMQLRFKKAEIGLRNATIAKNIRFFKAFLRWAAKDKYYMGDLHDTFHPKFKGIKDDEKEVIHLSWDELMYLYGLKFENIEHEQVRDVFCFCCFTSLRHSDVLKLRRSDVKDSYIKVVTKKTIGGLKIELNKYSSAILDKYKDVEFADNKVLPVMSIQKMNDYLKEIGEIAKFDEQIRIIYFVGSQRYEEVSPKYELLTTHCGRRTFIVNSLYLGIPAEVVMSWTGHSDYTAMKPYIKIVDTLKEQQMNKFNNK
jgi:integrase